MRAIDMIAGHQYKIASKARPIGFRVVECESRTRDDFVIVHERGELDMQSCFAIPGTEEVQEVLETTQTDRCPACWERVLPTANSDNPACRRNNAMCNCGWMGMAWADERTIQHEIFRKGPPFQARIVH